MDQRKAQQQDPAIARIAVVVAAWSLPVAAADKPLMIETLQTLVDDGQYEALLAQANTYLERDSGNRDARFFARGDAGWPGPQQGRHRSVQIAGA